MASLTDWNGWDGEDGDTEWRANSVKLKASLKWAHLHEARLALARQGHCSAYGKAAVDTARSTASKLLSLLSLAISMIDLSLPYVHPLTRSLSMHPVSNPSPIGSMARSTSQASKLEC